MTDGRRQLLMRLVLVLDAVVCAAWVYWSLSSLFRMVRDTGSGGIGSVSVSLVSPAGLELFLTVAAPVISIWLAHLSASAGMGCTDRAQDQGDRTRPGQNPTCPCRARHGHRSLVADSGVPGGGEGGEAVLHGGAGSGDCRVRAYRREQRLAGLRERAWQLDRDVLV